MSPEVYLRDVDRLRKSTCSLVGQIDDSEKWEKKKNAIVLGVSGVAIGIADGAALYFALGLLSPPAFRAQKEGGPRVARHP